MTDTHPIKNTLEKCLTFLEIILQSEPICAVDPSIPKVTQELIDELNTATIELHKLLMSTEYVNEMIESMQQRLNEYDAVKDIELGEVNEN